jgi:outer membrane protein assembly factor BamB
MNPENEEILQLEKINGYPLFLDNRIFVIGNEQNTITALDADARELWSYDFPAPITCVDAAGGYLLAGTLNGAIILLNPSGAAAFPPFEPGGSRLSVILGCAISRDASRLAVISGIDEQRFLLLEQSGDTYKVIYHEFLPGGFRRPVHINFADNDGKVAFEREGGLGIYDIGSRASIKLNLEGEIYKLDDSGGSRYLFVITKQGPKQMSFITIRYPGHIVINAPFKSDNSFFSRRDSYFYLGSDTSIASFKLENR